MRRMSLRVYQLNRPNEASERPYATQPFFPKYSFPFEAFLGCVASCLCIAAGWHADDETAFARQTRNSSKTIAVRRSAPG